MAALLIRKLDDDLKTRLRLRAATHGRSMEEEARTILRQVLGPDPSRRTGADLVAGFREAFGPFGGVELDIPARLPMRDPPRFDE